MPKISVIIPVYNVEKYLPECLDSVLAQTFQDFEIICVNDGSQDSSPDILKTYAEKDKRIRLITQANQGQAIARNRGLGEAEGKWISFMDADDILPPFALQILYDLALQTQVPIVSSRAFLKVADDAVRSKLQIPVVTAPVPYQVWTKGLADFVKDPKIFSSPCNKLFQASLLRQFRFPEGIVFEDWPLMTVLFGQIQNYATTNIPCYVYRERHASTMRSPFNQYKAESYLRGIQFVYEAFSQTNQLTVAQKRMAVAVKMLVNKVYHAKDKELNQYLLAQMKILFEEGVIQKRHLNWKTRWRLLCLQYK